MFVIDDDVTHDVGYDVFIHFSLYLQTVSRPQLPKLFSIGYASGRL